MSKQRTANLLGALACEIADKLDRHFTSHASETDSAAAALNIIGYDDGCSNSALSRALRLSHTATVRLVDKLEAAGLVTSKRGDDRRTVALHLTKAGKARVRRVAAERTDVLCEIVEVLTPRQREHLDAVAEALLVAMTSTIDIANYVCRLCDDSACPPDACPVHQTAVRLERSGGAAA